MSKKIKPDFYSLPVSESFSIDPKVTYVTIKRIGDTVWSKYDHRQKKLIPIEDSNFDGVFESNCNNKKLSTDIEIWTLSLTCRNKVYEFGYFYNQTEGARQTTLGKFHKTLTNLVSGDIVKLWISKLGDRSIKMGVTVNDIKIPFDI